MSPINLLLISSIVNPIMVPLISFSLPLQDRPPVGYGWERRDSLVLSTTTASYDAHRDKFLGDKRCVICGSEVDLFEDCPIVGQEIVSSKEVEQS